MHITPSYLILRDYLLSRRRCLAMKSAADFAQRERVAVSELSRLSSDPALTFRPDPAFRAKFRKAGSGLNVSAGSLDNLESSDTATLSRCAKSAADFIARHLRLLSR